MDASASAPCIHTSIGRAQADVATTGFHINIRASCAHVHAASATGGADYTANVIERNLSPTSLRFHAAVDGIDAKIPASGVGVHQFKFPRSANIEIGGVRAPTIALGALSVQNHGVAFGVGAHVNEFEGAPRLLLRGAVHPLLNDVADVVGRTALNVHRTQVGNQLQIVLCRQRSRCLFDPRIALAINFGLLRHGDGCQREGEQYDFYLRFHLWFSLCIVMH